MQRIIISLWTVPVLLTVLWLATSPFAAAPANFFQFRAIMVQYTGILAVGCMGLCMILALRPRWPEKRLGGLDKMYRLHKWFGIAALVAGVVHWLWAKGPKWAVGWGSGWNGRNAAPSRFPTA